MANWHHHWHQNGGHMGTLTIIQRFGSGLNLDVHFHTLGRDGLRAQCWALPPVSRIQASPQRLMACLAPCHFFPG